MLRMQLITRINSNGSTTRKIQMSNNYGKNIIYPRENFETEIDNVRVSQKEMKAPKSTMNL